jgi:hypothetical protein
LILARGRALPLVRVVLGVVAAVFRPRLVRAASNASACGLIERAFAADRPDLTA